MDICEKDENFGKVNEANCLEQFRELFDSALKINTNKWATFDYSCDGCYVELKSRRCAHNKYKDIMIGLNKIQYCSNMTRPVYFCFSFEDGIYYWKYNKEDLENGNVVIRKGGRTDRGVDETKDCAYINSAILKKV